MTTDEKRIKVLEWMGWTHVRLLDGGTIWGTKPGHESKNWKAGCEHDTIVPPLTLDWIHECVEKLRENAFLWVKYPEVLFEIVSGRKFNGDFGYFLPNFSNATKEQRLDALVKMIGEK